MFSYASLFFNVDRIFDVLQLASMSGCGAVVVSAKLDCVFPRFQWLQKYPVAIRCGRKCVVGFALRCNSFVDIEAFPGTRAVLFGILDYLFIHFYKQVDAGRIVDGRIFRGFFTGESTVRFQWPIDHIDYRKEDVFSGRDSAAASDRGCTQPTRKKPDLALLSRIAVDSGSIAYRIHIIRAGHRPFPPLGRQIRGSEPVQFETGRLNGGGFAGVCRRAACREKGNQQTTKE